MKKRLVVALLAMSLLVPTGALAASFPPASLAFQWGAAPEYTVLTIKLVGNIRMYDGRLKFYQLNGIH